MLCYTVLYFKHFLLPPLLKYIDFTSVSVRQKKREVTMQKNKTKKKYKKKAVAIKHNTITFFFTGLSSFLWRTYYYYSSVLTPPAPLGLLLMIIEHDEIESY